MMDLALNAFGILAFGLALFFFPRYVKTKGLSEFNGTLLRDRMKYNWICSWIIGPAYLAISYQDIESLTLTLGYALLATPLVYLFSVRYYKKRIHEGVMRYEPDHYKRNAYWDVPIAFIILGAFIVADVLWGGFPFNHPLFIGTILSWPLSAPFLWLYVRYLERRLGKEIWEASA